MESLGRILKAPRGQTQGQKPEGPQAPRVFGRGSGRGGPSIYSRGTPLSTRGTSRGAPFTIIPPRLFHRLSFFLDPEEIKSNKTNKRTTLKRLPMVAPRVSTGISFYQWWPLTSSPRVTKQNTDISTQVWWLPHRYLCGHHHTCVLMTTHMWLFQHKCGDDHICTYVVITTPVTSWPRVTKQKTNISKQVCT